MAGLDKVEEIMETGAGGTHSESRKRHKTWALSGSIRYDRRALVEDFRNVEATREAYPCSLTAITGADRDGVGTSYLPE